MIAYLAVVSEILRLTSVIFVQLGKLDHVAGLNFSTASHQIRIQKRA